MNSQPNPRIKTVLPVRLSGIDTEGVGYSELGHTLDISRSGARIGGVRCSPRVGDEIDLQYRNSRARYRVVWIGRSAAPGESVLGLHALAPKREIWGIQFPETSGHHEQQHGSPPHVRYAVRGRVQVRPLMELKGIDTRLYNLSADGCYCRTTRTVYAPLTRVSVFLRIEFCDIAAYGVVRSSDPNTGMDIQFTNMVSEADKERLRQLIERLRKQKAGVKRETVRHS